MVNEETESKISDEVKSQSEPRKEQKRKKEKESLCWSIRTSSEQKAKPSQPMDSWKSCRLAYVDRIYVNNCKAVTL